MVVILAVLSLVLFGLLSAMPGNPVDMLVTSNPRVKPEDVIRLKKLRGLDKPWYVQYVRWIWGYHEPFRPPSVREFDTLNVPISSDGVASVRVDIADSLFDPDTRFSKSSLEGFVAKARPEIWDALINDPSLNVFDDEAIVDRMLEKIARLDDSYYDQLIKVLQKEAVKTLKVEGIFGATAEGAVLTQVFDSPGFFRIWFIVSDAQGLQQVASIPVEIEANSEMPKRSVFAIDELPPQVVDAPEKFKVDLASYVLRGDESSGSLKYFLDEKSPGKIDKNGIYRHIFEDSGQTAIMFGVSDRSGRSTKGAFSVEHGPIPNPNLFNRGFLFAFAGDKDALGFSSTYKRPVWELLMGTEPICGNGRVDPGETCDDGNLKSNDGCNQACQIESMSFFGKIEATISGWLVRSGRIGNTLQLMLPAILISLLIAIPLGILSAYKQYSWLDYIVNFLAFIGISLPVFWFAIMVIFLFGEQLQWLPAGGIQTPGIQEEGLWAVLEDRFTHAALPILVLSIAYTGRWLRYMRSSMLEVLPSDYVRTARAKGLGESTVILKHAMRNALIPVVTVLALSVPALFGGAVLTETVFSWPGIGRLQYDAVMNSDYYVAIVVFLISASLVMLGNLLADVAYVVVDPRIRHK